MNTLINRSFYSDNLTIKVFAEYDESPDFSYLGEFTDSMNWDPETGIYHRSSGLMYDGTHWRTETGKFASEPDPLNPRYSSECEFIDIGSCQFSRKDKNWLKYAFQNAKRLDNLGRTWDYVFVRAEIELDGKEIGSACVGGYESDMSDSEFNSIARELLAEAFQDARQFKDRIRAS